MKQDGNTMNQLDRLANLLDTFGCDPDRWPAAERAVLESFMRTDKSAKQMFVEAKALARVMDTASAGNASAALSARIVASALEDPAREARVVPLAPKHARTGRPFSIRRAASMWPAAALAASFAFGLYMGVSGIGGTEVEGVLQIAMTESSGNDADAISWLEDISAGDEDGLL